MERLNELPTDSRQLIEALDKLYPHRCIAVGQTLEEAHRDAGRRDLIDYLLDLVRLSNGRAERESQQVRIK